MPRTPHAHQPGQLVVEAERVRVARPRQARIARDHLAADVLGVARRQVEDRVDDEHVLHVGVVASDPLHLVGHEARLAASADASLDGRVRAVVAEERAAALRLERVDAGLRVVAMVDQRAVRRGQRVHVEEPRSGGLATTAPSSKRCRPPISPPGRRAPARRAARGTTPRPRRGCRSRDAGRPSARAA